MRLSLTGVAWWFDREVFGVDCGGWASSFLSGMTGTTQEGWG
jgi:hypothetical protein